MAVIWQREINDVRYEVRTAGRTRRLYTNGVLHTQRNPGRLMTGSVWDLLSIPSLFRAPQRTRKVLVLGVGGGTVIHQLRALVQPDQIEGIDLSAIHLRLAREYFGLKRLSGVRLYHADAVAWMKQTRTQQYDLIIDDLFSAEGLEAERAVAADPLWMDELCRGLNSTGMLVMNFASYSDLRGSAACTDRRVRRRFVSSFSLQNDRVDNRIGVFMKTPSSSKQLRERLLQHDDASLALRRGQLQYRIRTLNLETSVDRYQIQ